MVELCVIGVDDFVLRKFVQGRYAPVQCPAMNDIKHCNACCGAFNLEDGYKLIHCKAMHDFSIELARPLYSVKGSSGDFDHSHIMEYQTTCKELLQWAAELRQSEYDCPFCGRPTDSHSDDCQLRQFVFIANQSSFAKGWPFFSFRGFRLVRNAAISVGLAVSKMEECPFCEVSLKSGAQHLTDDCFLPGLTKPPIGYEVWLGENEAD